MIRRIALLCVALALPAVGQTTLNGAGATFPYPMYSKGFSEYHKAHPDIQINYQSIGSGGGIRQLLDKTVDFGASDGPMNDEQLIDNALTFYLAGHETTAKALTWTLYLLARSPQWSAALEEEVARVTGGIQEIIEDYDPTTDSGYGFLCYEYSSDAFWDAMKRARQTFSDQRLWTKLMKRAMARNFSWDASAQRYEALYSELVGAPDKAAA